MSGTQPDRWTETREALTVLVDWLDDARRWATSGADNEPADDEVQQAAQAFQADEPGPDDTPQRAAPDLHAIVSEMTALRHEVKLQTRTARQDRELAAKTADQLANALAQLERSRADDSARIDSAVSEARRNDAELLVDLHDAFSRSFAEADRVKNSVIASIQSLHSSWNRSREDQSYHSADVPTTFLDMVRSLFGRLPFRAPSNPAVNERGTAGKVANAATSDSADLEAIAIPLQGLNEGNALALRRIERALVEFGIEPIQAIGLPVDHETMEVVQSARDPDRPSGIVLAEVRRGYRRQGRIMRFAQVVVNS